MPARRSRRFLGQLVGAVALLAYCFAIGETKPFTVAADAATAVPLGLLLVLLVLQRARRRAVPQALARRAPPRAVPNAVAWLAVAIGAVAWELANLFSAPRSAHPTISSLLDKAEASTPGRALLCLAWLLFGWWLATR